MSIDNVATRKKQKVKKEKPMNVRFPGFVTLEGTAPAKGAKKLAASGEVRNGDKTTSPDVTYSGQDLTDEQVRAAWALHPGLTYEDFAGSF